MNAETLRTQVFSDLNAIGFLPAKSLPDPDLGQSLRATNEIAARLMALDALFTWVAFPEVHAPTARVEKYIERNRLAYWLTAMEVEIISMPRADAHEAHVNNIGWKLENMWALAWVLGFSTEPALDASQIEPEVSQPMIFEFLPGLDATVAMLIERNAPRSADQVIAMEYRFYCAHNAVRSAQLGGETVPDGFHPVVHGGAIHERRHSLTWCLSPQVPWEDTDLST